jgi:hypothetical protein
VTRPDEEPGPAAAVRGQRRDRSQATSSGSGIGRARWKPLGLLGGQGLGELPAPLVLETLDDDLGLERVRQLDGRRQDGLAAGLVDGPDEQCPVDLDDARAQPVEQGEGGVAGAGVDQVDGQPADRAELSGVLGHRHELGGRHDPVGHRFQVLDLADVGDQDRELVAAELPTASWRRMSCWSRTAISRRATSPAWCP